MKNKTCLITDGNAGIGKAAAIQLAKAGVEVMSSFTDERDAFSMRDKPSKEAKLE